MAISFPMDLLADFPGWSTYFDLPRRQEQSRHASGRTRIKDIGPPIWRASYQSRTLSPNQLDRWRARLSALDGGEQTFLGYAMSRCRPMAHPGSSTLPEGTLHTIDANDKAIRVSGLTGITLSVGDHISIIGNVYQVMEDAVAVSGLTPLFEVRPHIWTGTAISDVVKISKPSCQMTVDPGSVSTNADPKTGRGTISFSATEARG